MLLALPAVVQGQFTWTTNNGTITITEYTGPGGAVTIPATITGLPVTSIGSSAFAYRTDLASITIATNVTNIGDEAFNVCTSLTSVIIPSSVTNIGSYAFYECGLTSVTIPNRVTSIGESAFNGCTSLTSVSIPNSVTRIGAAPFAACDSLTAITVDALNPAYSSVDGVLFDKSQTTLIQCPAGGRAGTYLVPDSVTRILDYAFYSCTSLTNIAIPNSVTNLAIYAFYYCTSLTSVTIPKGVASIGPGAFAGCASLSAIMVDALNPAYSSVDGVLFDKSQTTLVQYPAGKAGPYRVRNSVTTIGAGAFGSCLGLTNLTIPDSVGSIGNRAFSHCFNLTSVYFQGNAPNVDIPVFFLDDSATVYYLPGTLGWGPSFGGVPAVLWNPLMQTTGRSFGTQGEQFGITITGTANIPILVEACTNLASASWTSLRSCTITNGSIYFSDPQWTNYPRRFYRIRSL